MKINLNELSFDKIIQEIKKYHKNKIKSNGYYDPFITQRNIMKKFIITKDLATECITHLQKDYKYSHYVDYFI